MTVRTLDLGHVGYLDCVSRQRAIVEQVIGGGESTLVFVEHPPVLTLGAAFHEENLLHPPQRYRDAGIEVERTDRGGDVTYHGPGQLVVYPIFRITDWYQDLHRWIRDLEETMLVALHHWGIQGRRFPPHTGAWVGDEKIAAIGIKVRRWVSMHGIALNCDVDLRPFDEIVPCGIRGYGVTSLQKLGVQASVNDAKPVVAQSFAEVFGVEVVD